MLENGLWRPLDGGVNGAVNALQGIDRCVYACGFFTSAGASSVIGGVAVRSAARWCEGTQDRIGGWEAVDFAEGPIGVCNSIAVA